LFFQWLPSHGAEWYSRLFVTYKKCLNACLRSMRVSLLESRVLLVCRIPNWAATAIAGGIPGTHVVFHPPSTNSPDLEPRRARRKRPMSQGRGLDSMPAVRPRPPHPRRFLSPSPHWIDRAPCLVIDIGGTTLMHAVFGRWARLLFVEG
jgi:hypothetical protein